MVQTKLFDVLFHTTADNDPRLCPIIHHRIDFDLDSVSTKMFCDQHFQHGTNFGFVTYYILRVSSAVISRVRVLSTRACDAISLQLESKISHEELSCRESPRATDVFAEPVSAGHLHEDFQKFSSRSRNKSPRASESQVLMLGET